MPDRSMTKHLQKTKSGNHDVACIVNHFWETARRAARRHLRASARRFQSKNDLANAAVRSALSELPKSRSRNASRDGFEELVVRIVHRKRKNAQCYARAGRHSMRQSQSDGKELPQLSDASPYNVAQAESLGQQIVETLKKEHDQLRRDIAIAGIAGEAEAREIVREIGSFDGRAPALGTVQATIRKAKKKLAAQLREEYGELLGLEPDKTNIDGRANHAPKKGAGVPRSSAMLPGKARKRETR